MAKAEKTAKVKEAESKAKVVKKPKAADKQKEVKDGHTQETSQIPVEAAQGPEIKNEAYTPAEESKPESSLAKAGKRSAKSVREAEEKQAKEERKAAQSAEALAKAERKAPQSKQRTAEDRLKSRGKKYRKAFEQIDKTKTYGVKQALELAIQTATTKFDATVELHIRLSVDPKQADQNVRGTVVLPAGTGKAVRVAVFAAPDDVAAAKKAGADIAASEEFLQQLDKGELNFDVLIATPAMMPRLGKYARVLGPKGLMPNPKSGTVTADVAKAVKEAKAGRVEYRVDSTGIVHVGIGKTSFGADKLFDNAKVIMASIKANKPASIKGSYILSVFTASTMGPSTPIDLADINSL